MMVISMLLMVEPPAFFVWVKIQHPSSALPSRELADVSLLFVPSEIVSLTPSATTTRASTTSQPSISRIPFIDTQKQLPVEVVNNMVS